MHVLRRSQLAVTVQLSFFLQLRHITSAQVGKGKATLFVLSYDDYIQLCRSYTADANLVIETIVGRIISSDKQDPEEKSVHSEMTKNTKQAANTKAAKRIHQAIQRQTQINTAKLLDAAVKNDVGTAKQLLNSGIVSAQDTASDGRAALHIASTCGHVEMVSHLLDDFKADPSATDGYGETPLDAAVRAAHMDIVNLLSSAGAPSIRPSVEYQLQLMASALSGDIATLKLLRAAGMNFACTTSSGKTVLHVAAHGNQLEVVKYLLTLPEVKLDTLDDRGCCPVWEAARLGYSNVVRLFKEAGAKHELKHGPEVCQKALVNDAAWLKVLFDLELEFQFRVRCHRHADPSCCSVRGLGVHAVEGCSQVPSKCRVRKGRRLCTALLWSVPTKRVPPYLNTPGAKRCARRWTFMALHHTTWPSEWGSKLSLFCCGRVVPFKGKTPSWKELKPKSYLGSKQRRELSWNMTCKRPLPRSQRSLPPSS